MSDIILSVEQMRKADAYTIKNFISSRELMYKAGKAVYEVANLKDSVAIICGSGNNAGDGYVLATLLKESNVYCKLFLISDKFSEDGKYYFNKCLEKGIEYEFITETSEYTNFACIVDCIYGTGFRGELKKDIIKVVENINSSKAYIVSVDINSGMNGDSGAAKLCINSDLTVSIGFLKLGLVSENAKKHIKKLINVDIGIVLEK